MAYVFAILNSLQGVFIFIFHCIMNDKVSISCQMSWQSKVIWKWWVNRLTYAFYDLCSIKQKCLCIIAGKYYAI